MSDRLLKSFDDKVKVVIAAGSRLLSSPLLMLDSWLLLTLSVVNLEKQLARSTIYGMSEG